MKTYIGITAVVVLAVLGLANGQRRKCSSDADCLQENCCVTMFRVGSCWSRSSPLARLCGSIAKKPCIDNLDCSENECCHVDIANPGQGVCKERPASEIGSPQLSRFCGTARAKPCIDNLDCSQNECCRVDVENPDMGKCEPHPDGRHGLSGTSMFCPTADSKTCTSQTNCSSHECCKVSANGLGQCVQKGEIGDICGVLTSPDTVADHCPCDVGLDCKGALNPSTFGRGVCQSHLNAGCQSHDECPRGCCRSLGGSVNICTRSMDRYAKCKPMGK